MKSPSAVSGFARLVSFGFIVMVALSSAKADEGKGNQLEGIYTCPNTMINDRGEEQVVIYYSGEILELRGNQFRYWFYSDDQGEEKYPIAGAVERQGPLIILHHDKWSKRYISATVDGVFGLWTEDGLATWRHGKKAMHPAILVRVGDGPVVGDAPHSEEFKYPSIKALFDPKDVGDYWAKEKQDYEDRYSDLHEPLKSFLREYSKRDDANLAGYQEAVRIFQKNPDPVLLRQMVEVMGNGPHPVVVPLALDDLFLSGPLVPGPPAFMATPETRMHALGLLVDAIPHAKDSGALTKIMLVFLEASGIHQMDLTLSDGQKLKFSRNGTGTSYNTFRYGSTAAAECQAWAMSKIKELSPPAEPAK